MANVNVTYDEMKSAATRLDSGQQEIQSKLDELQKLVNGLVNGGYVTDASSRQFESAYHHFTSGARQTMEGLHEMGKYLHTAADTFQRADHELSQKLNQH
jgi:WXG100 family type VII secretion target